LATSHILKRALRLLFVADVNGAPGLRAVERLLPGLRDELGVDFCAANGENAADGLGITPHIAERILASGADVITLGNHTWRRKEVIPYLAETDRVIRPANLSKHTPGRGMTFAEGSNGTTVAVINLLGQLYLSPPEGPWEVVDELVAEARRTTPVILVDFHGEATSEKVAMAAYLDGKVTAVLGTHTHVQTNDARVSSAGTAAITDAGMTGPHDSVIGVVTELAVEQMRTGVPIRFRTASGGVRLEGVLVECGEDGRATRCETVRVELPS
jgi:2',3'-cyclic-nucleotide 2'-phosphodiesterase